LLTIIRKLQSFLFFSTTHRFAELQLKVARKSHARIPIAIVEYDNDHKCPYEMLRTIKGKTKDWMRRWKRGDISYVAYVDNEPVAHIWICHGEWRFRDEDIGWPLPQKSAFLYDALVRKEWRGQGVYPNLISTAAEGLRSRCHEKLYLLADFNNLPGVRAIEKVGFRPTNNYIHLYRLFKLFSFRRDSVHLLDHLQNLDQENSHTEARGRGAIVRLCAELSTLHRRFHEYGFWKFTVTYGHRLARAILPPCIFRSADAFLMELPKVCPEEIPSRERGGYKTRLAMEDDLASLCRVSPKPRLFLEFFKAGSICAVAENDDGIVAQVWASVGPVDCVADDSYKHGYRWRLKKGEAWIHNSISHPDYRGSYRGWVFVIAFRRLLEELSKFGVSRCYGLILKENKNSLNVHRRLHMQAVAHFSYRRLLFFGLYRLRSRERTMSRLTLRRSLTVNVRNFGEQRFGSFKGWDAEV